MKRLPALPVVLLLSTFCAAQAGSAAELELRADQANGAQCAHLSMQAARRSLEDADRFFQGGGIQAAHGAIDVSLHYAERSVDCTLQTHKHKHAKDVEIQLRELIRRMNDVRQTLDYQDRPQLSQAMVELERQRDRLLQALFGPLAAGVAEKAP